MYSVKKSWKESLMREYHTPAPKPAPPSTIRVKIKFLSLLKNPLFFFGGGLDLGAALWLSVNVGGGGGGGVRGISAEVMVVSTGPWAGGGGVRSELSVSDVGRTGGVFWSA